MSVPLEEGLIRAWAYALALVVFCLPIYSPDLFWHLSAGRWILAHLAVPSSDSFTFTALGAPWIDFEWGTQAAWFGAHALGGLRALWVLKMLVLAAAFWPVDGLLRDAKASGAARAGALALWLGAMLAQSDLRADLMSAVFFAVILRRLARGRASFLFGFGLFALWANLHAGFVMGFLLYALAAATGAEGISAEATGAVLGSLMNPYGAAIYKVLGAHASGSVAKMIFEWGPPSLRVPFQAPLVIALLLTAGVAWVERRRASRFLLLTALGTGAAAALSARFGTYFAAGGTALVFTAYARPRVSAVFFGLALMTGLLILPVKTTGLGAAFFDGYVARRGCDFVATEKPLRALRLFNQYEWGGYLGWRLNGGLVFGDGRYLFLSQLGETQEALQSPAALAEFARRRALDGFLIKNYPGTTASLRAYPDGTTKEFARPWHVSFFPRERWALAYWDDQALLFVDRAKVPADWLAAHEYRWLRPGDGAALADARARGEVPEAALAAEARRHQAETGR